MYITATSLSMDASQTYKEVEQRVRGLSSTPVSGTTDGFGIRLASMLASTTQTQINCQSAICQTANSTAPSTPVTDASGQTTLLSRMRPSKSSVNR